MPLLTEKSNYSAANKNSMKAKTVVYLMLFAAFFMVSCKELAKKASKSTDPIERIETLSNDVSSDGDEWSKEDWDDAADELENALGNLPNPMTSDEQTIVGSDVSRIKVYAERHRRKASGILEAIERFQPAEAEAAPEPAADKQTAQVAQPAPAQPAVTQTAPPPATTTVAPPVAGLLPAHVIREGGYTNVRQGPGTNYAIVTKVKDGSPIYYTNYNANWKNVYNTAGQFLGYMHSSKVIPDGAATAPAATSRRAAVATGTIYDWLAQRYVTDADIRNCSSAQLRILRNAIYARHYRRFKDAGLRQHFNTFQWYDGYRDEIPASELNKYEKYNIQFIQRYE